MRKGLAVLMVGLWAAAGPALPASAAGNTGVSLSAAILPFGSGAAGTGIGAPDYTDAFDTGFGLRVEPYMDITPRFRGLIGFTYQTWGGKTFGGFEFDDLKMWALYAGGRVRFYPGQAIRPYALMDLGIARLDSVSITSFGVTEPYWDSTVTAFVDLGLGLEFVASPNLSFYIDARLQAFGEPDSAMPPDSDAEGGGVIPISLGLNYTF